MLTAAQLGNEPMKYLNVDLRELTASERLALIEEIWKSLSSEEVDLNEGQRTELDRRLDEFEVDREPGIPGTDALRRIRERQR